MHSVPERNRRDDRSTRRQQYGDGHPYTQLPPLRGWEWVASTWQDAGMAGYGAGGPVPLTWAELDAYNRVMGGVYTMWALGVVRRMSEAYVGWLAKGSKQGDIALDVPYIKRDANTMAAAAQHLMRMRDQSAANYVTG